MAKRIHQKFFSIRYKFLAVTSGLLVLCVLSYLLMATWVFKEDKKQLMYEYSQSHVKNLTKEIDSILTSIRDRLDLYTQLQYLKGNDQSLFNQSHVAAIIKKSKTDTKVEVWDGSYFNLYGIDKEQVLKEVSDQSLTGVKESLKGSQNLSVPFLQLARQVFITNKNNIPVEQYHLIAFIKPDSFFNSMSSSKKHSVILYNDQGQALLSYPKDTNFGLLDAKKTELLKAQMFDSGVVDTLINNKEYLGAFAKGFNQKYMLVTGVERAEVFSVIYRFIFRSVLFSFIVATLALMTAALFSDSLTKPLQRLVESMNKVKKGDLSQQIKIKSKDEIEMLGSSFNKMILELKSSRLELIAINKDLENKVKERTRQLEEQNQAVKHAQEALLRTTKLAAIGEVAGHAAHEVLNPLTSILNRLGRIKEKMTQSAQQDLNLVKEIYQSWEKDYTEGGFDKLVSVWKQPSSIDPNKSMWDEDLENIKFASNRFDQYFQMIGDDTEFLTKESQRIDRIIQNMRHLNTNKADIRRQSVHELLDEAKNIMADWADQLDVKMELHLDAKDDHSEVDADEMIQALTNLIRNSLQAIKEKPNKDNEKILISTQNINDQLLISIKDTGVGIDPEHQKHLFEKQFSTKPQTEGTGIGLGISRRFVRQFYGDIELKDSAPGLGCEFVISLPLSEKLKREVA